MDINEAVGAVLSERMKEGRWTKAEVARRFGVTYKTMWVLLTGNKNTTVHDLCRVCELIDVSPSEVLDDARRRVREHQKESPR